MRDDMHSLQITWHFTSIYESIVLLLCFFPQFLSLHAKDRGVPCLGDKGLSRENGSVSTLSSIGPNRNQYISVFSRASST